MAGRSGQGSKAQGRCAVSKGMSLCRVAIASLCAASAGLSALRTVFVVMLRTLGRTGTAQMRAQGAKVTMVI